MTYAFIENTMKSIDFNMYAINYFITDKYEYENIKKEITSEDTLLIEKGSLIGNSINQVITELLKLKEMGIHFIVLDSPVLTDMNTAVMKALEYFNDLKVISPVKYGRPKSECPVKFDRLYRMYLKGKTKEAIQLSGLSRATFYRRLEEYEKANNIEKRRNSNALIYGKLLDNSDKLLNV